MTLRMLGTDLTCWFTISKKKVQILYCIFIVSWIFYVAICLHTDITTSTKLLSFNRVIYLTYYSSNKIRIREHNKCLQNKAYIYTRYLIYLEFSISFTGYVSIVNKCNLHKLLRPSFLPFTSISLQLTVRQCLQLAVAHLRVNRRWKVGMIIIIYDSFHFYVAGYLNSQVTQVYRLLRAQTATDYVSTTREGQGRRKKKKEDD